MKKNIIIAILLFTPFSLVMGEQNNHLGTISSLSYTNDNNINAPIINSNIVANTIKDKNLRMQCSQFIDNILQIPSAVVWEYIDKINQKNQSILESDTNLYNQCLIDIAQLTPAFSHIKKLRALQHQKAVLGMQILHLIGTDTIDGALEIGTPGTYISTIRYATPINGPIYALSDKMSLVRQMIMAFCPDKASNGFLPYDIFVPLENYSPIKPEIIAPNSIDLAICTIGLHHITLENIDAFIASLAQSIRPGGYFVLREHNCFDNETLQIAHTAHTLFNLLISNASLEEEQTEYRNFQPLEYWITLLKKHGLILSKKTPLLQKGDPTLNTLLLFTKEPITTEEKIIHVSHQLKTNKKYVRDAIQTNLTTVEWFDVDASQDYGNFINHTPFYEYPWFSTAKTYASLFLKSWNVAAKKSGHLAVLTSPYTSMNTFIATSKIIECTIKGVISYPLHLLFSDEESSTIQLLIHDPDNKWQTINPTWKLIRHFQKSDLYLIEAPRYRCFLESMAHLEKTPNNCTIIEIAGQKDVQLKVNTNITNQTDIACDGCSILYSWQMPSQKEKIYYALSVESQKLLTVMRHLTHNHIQINYIHDF